MNQAPHDLRDYLLEELDARERAEIESWLAGSAEGREELERLRATHSALLSLPAEEPQRRIAFVSDKIFEPSPWARLTRWFQLEGPRFALGLAAMLAVLFAGAALTEPRVTIGGGEFELAFGPGADAVQVETAAATTEELSPEAVRAIIQEAVAAESARRDEATAELVAARLAQTETAFRQAMAEDRNDIETGYFLLNNRIDELVKGFSIASAEVR